MGNLADENWSPNSSHKRQKKRHLKKRNSQSLFSTPTPPAKKLKVEPQGPPQIRIHLSNKKKKVIIERFDVVRAGSTSTAAALQQFCSRNRGVPYQTMRSFLRNRQTIFSAVDTGKSEARSTRSVSWLQKQQIGKFDEEENILFTKFIAERVAGKQVLVIWFAPAMQKLLNKRKPPGWEAFTASDGWRQKYFERFNIVIRQTTNTKHQTIAERLPKVLQFYRYFQQVCNEDSRVCSKYGAYPLAQRIHIDEVPFELGGVLNSTVEVKGTKRVQVKHPKFRIETRQASLMLSFCADGSIGPVAICLARTPLPLGGQDPLLITKHILVDPRKPLTPVGRKEFDDLRVAHPNILLYCQPKAYFDVRTFSEFMKDFLKALPHKPHVVIMDNADGHVTDHVQAECKTNDVRLVFTPGSCTDMCAVTDAGLGRSLKLLMKKKFREDFSTNLDLWCAGKVTATDRRRRVVEWFDEAVAEFRKSGRQQIVEAHQRCGSGLLCDGSENHLIKIDGYDGDIIV